MKIKNLAERQKGELVMKKTNFNNNNLNEQEVNTTVKVAGEFEDYSYYHGMEEAPTYQDNYGYYGELECSPSEL